MREERLLERLRYLEQNPDMREVRDPSRVMDSIMNHLMKLLNTRQGSALIAEDFGIPDITDMLNIGGMDSMRELEDILSNVVAKFEPRLSGVRVVFVPQDSDPFSMFFKLQGNMFFEGRQLPVVFETVLDPDGRIRVKH